MSPEQLKKNQETLSGTVAGLYEDKLWGDIRRMALNDEGLKDLLEKVKMYYQLKKTK